MPRTVTKAWLYGLAALLFLAIILSMWRISEFGQIEPRQDQAHFQHWVRALSEAKHWLPERAAGQTWRVALEADTRSAASVILQQIYVAPLLVFTLLSVMVFTAAAAVLGTSFEIQVLLTIVSSALAAVVLAFIPWAACTGRTSPEARRLAILAGAIAVAFAAVSSFLHVVSAFGIHNFAVLMMLLVVLTGTRWLALLEADGDSGPIRSAGAVVLAVYTATLFANHAAAVLCPPAMAFAILCANRVALRRRLMLIAGLVGWTVVSFLPFWIPLWLSLQPDYLGDLRQGLFVVGSSPLPPALTTMSGRAEGWVSAMAMYFSAPGLILTSVGLFGLAIKHRVRLPLLLTGVHAACGILIPDFTQFDRTLIYLLPLLCLGAGWTLAIAVGALFKRPRVGASWMILGAAVAALAGLHLFREIPRLADPLRIEPWGFYLAEQGGWRPMQREIETLLPENALLVPWDHQINHIYSSLRPSDGRGPALFIPLSTLFERQRNGTLATYLARRQIMLPTDAPVFILGPPQDNELLAQRVSAVFREAQFEGPNSSIRLDIVRDWRDKSGRVAYPSLVLYRVVR